eukprot:SAG22_NODE_405_length_11004_cov_4.629986_4_plen_249_part_00
MLIGVTRADGACGGIGLGARCTTGARRRCNGSSDGGIFFWDFRNASCRRYFRDVMVGGATGTGSEYVDGAFFDDAGPGTQQNPMVEYQNQLRAIAAHASLSEADVLDVANATHNMMVGLRASMYQQGKGAWLSSGDPSWFTGFDDHVQGNAATSNWWAAPTAGDICTSFYASLCRQQLQGPVAFTWNPGRRHGGWDLPDELVSGNACLFAPFCARFCDERQVSERYFRYRAGAWPLGRSSCSARSRPG